MNMPLHEFMDEVGPELSEQVEIIASSPDSLTDEQVAVLWGAIQHRLGDSVEYGADFDLAAEVESQIAMVRAMRRNVITDAGTVLPGVAARELKEVVSASTTLLSTLTKSHEKILSFDRMRSIETATVAAIKELPPERQALFFETLESRLSDIN